MTLEGVATVLFVICDEDISIITKCVGHRSSLAYFGAGDHHHDCIAASTRRECFLENLCEFEYVSLTDLSLQFIVYINHQTCLYFDHQFSDTHYPSSSFLRPLTFRQTHSTWVHQLRNSKPCLQKAFRKVKLKMNGEPSLIRNNFE
jgi:hypothetical protein